MLCGFGAGCGGGIFAAFVTMFTATEDFGFTFCTLSLRTRTEAGTIDVSSGVCWARGLFTTVAAADFTYEGFETFPDSSSTLASCAFEATSVGGGTPGRPEGGLVADGGPAGEATTDLGGGRVAGEGIPAGSILLGGGGAPGSGGLKPGSGGGGGSLETPGGNTSTEELGWVGAWDGLTRFERACGGFAPGGLEGGGGSGGLCSSELSWLSS